MEQADKISVEKTLYEQMHKQYLENDSAKTSSIISYLGAIAFVFTAYGYVYSYPYLHSDVHFLPSYKTIIVGTTIISYLILSFLAILAVNIGYCARKEHSRIYRIFNEVDSNFLKIERKSDNNPKAKWRKDFFFFLPDYYGILFVFFNIFIVVLCIASCMFDYTKILDHSCIFWVSRCILIVFCLIAVAINIIIWWYYFKKWEKKK